jgi:hypothetical protein
MDQTVSVQGTLALKEECGVLQFLRVIHEWSSAVEPASGSQLTGPQLLNLLLSSVSKVGSSHHIVPRILAREPDSIEFILFNTTLEGNMAHYGDSGFIRKDVDDT